MMAQALKLAPSSRQFPYLQVFAFYWQLDRGQEEAALGHLETALAVSAKAGPQFRHVIFLEAASTAAALRNDPAKARVWKERARQIRKTESLDVVEAGIATCEGRWADALPLWQSAQQRVVRRKLDSGLVRFAREKWRHFEALCREGVASDQGSGG